VAQKFPLKPSKPESVQAGCLKELGDLEMRILPRSHIENLLQQQQDENVYKNVQVMQVQQAH